MCDGGGRRSLHLYLWRWLRRRHLQPDGDRYPKEEGEGKNTLVWSYTVVNSSSSPLSGPCSPNPCKNDGLCEIVTPTRRGDVFNEYICKCQPGFEGVHCQISRSPPDVINECKLLHLACAPKQQGIYIPHNYLSFYTHLCCPF